MIYLVTNEPSLFENDSYKVVSIQESLQLLSSLKIVGFDTETEGLDPYTKELLLVQLGCKEFQVVVDCRTIDIREYKEFLESDRIFIGWNLKFDLKFMYRKGIYIRSVYDGFLAEKLMWLGYPTGMHGMSLKAAGETYLGIELDKSVRGKIIWSKTLTTDIIEYGANDVKYLEDIKTKQEEELIKKDLIRAVDIENRFVLPLSYCEYCGVKLNEAKWKAKMKADQQREQEALQACNKWVIDYYSEHRSDKELFIERDFVFNDGKQSYRPFGKFEILNKPVTGNYESYFQGEVKRIKHYFPFVEYDLQGDLFSGFNTEPKCVINWNSATQVIPLFKMFGVDVSTQDKKTKETKETVDAKQLKPQKDKCSLIPIYLEYKEAVKVTSTYGQNFLDQINPVSGRIHTNYQQMGADTTRITSGGKDKGNNVEYVNLLNLPADAETRACFVAEEGNKWISIDYSGQETYLMASIANDEAIINELVNGSGDIHSLTAYMSYSEIPRDTPIKEIKSKYHHLRQEAKGIEFAVNYGGDANTISNNKGIPIEEATKIYNDYMSGFKGLKRYQDFRRKDWFNKGYILLNPRDGHKAFIYDYEDLKADKEWMANLDWDYYRDMKKTDPNCYTVQRVRHFFQRKSASEKQSINYPIQGAGSMCLRYSLIIFFYWLRDNNLFDKVKICITPYDEVNLEAPVEIAEEVAQKIYECMVKGGSYFCTRCKLDADMSRLEDGSLPTYWIH